MKKENSVPVKPGGGGVNCQDACGGEEAESTNPVGGGRGGGAVTQLHRFFLSVGCTEASTALDTTSSAAISSCLLCASHIHDSS